MPRPSCDERGRCPGEHIDEAGRHRFACRIDLLVRARAVQVSNSSNAVTVNRYVAHKWITTEAVIDGAPANDDVVLGRCRCAR
jgi:hypothetical protein